MRRCPRCDHPGRALPQTTVSAMLRGAALERRREENHRFCPTAGCPVAYFGENEEFRTADVRVPIFCKEPAENRLVCYCFDVDEGEVVRAEVTADGHSTVFHRIRELVRKGRCACEVRNPHGGCCLGEVSGVEPGT